MTQDNCAPYKLGDAPEYAKQRVRAWINARTEQRGHCRIWTGYAGNDGRTPQASIEGKKWQVRRWVLFQVLPNAPKGLIAMRCCANERCIALGHMEAIFPAEISGWLGVRGRFKTAACREQRRRVGQQPQAIPLEEKQQMLAARREGLSYEKIAARFKRGKDRVRAAIEEVAAFEAGLERQRREEAAAAARAERERRRQQREGALYAPRLPRVASVFHLASVL